MNIQKLTLAGFGSYLEPQTIDFTKFGNNALFLITGPTGGGKTTILNAITYALYGCKNDGDPSVRTAHATPEQPTFVEMLFYVGHKHYRVKRSPSYIGVSKRGKGRTAKQEPNLEFYELIVKNGEIVETNLAKQKMSETQEEIVARVGRNFKQFMMTSMMRQNGFVELLNSSSKDRTEIFRTLFNTVNYSRVEDSFKTEFDKAKAEYDKTQAAVLKEFNKIRVTGNLELAEELEGYKKIAYENKIIETTALLEKIIAHDQVEANKAALELQANAQRIGELQGIANNKKRVADIQGMLPLVKENVVALQGKVETAEAEQRAAQSLYDAEYAKALAAKAELNTKAEIFTEINSKVNECGSLEQLLCKGQSYITKLTEAIKQDEVKEKEYTVYLEAQSEVPVQKANLKTVKSNTETVVGTIRQKTTAIRKIKSDEIGLAKAIEETKDKISKLEVSINNYKKAIDAAIEAQTRYQGLQVTLEKLNNEMAITKQLLQFIKAYEEEHASIPKLQQQYIQAVSKVAKQEETVRSMEKILLSQKGFAIAKELKEGDLCPVCGNHYVPGRVNFVAGTVTEKDLEKARSNKETLEQFAKKVYEALSDRVSRNTAKAEDIKQRGQVSYATDDIVEIKQKATDQEVEFSASLQGLQAEAQQLKNQADGINKLKQEEAKAQLLLKQLTEKQNASNSELSASISLRQSHITTLKQEMMSFKAETEPVQEQLDNVVAKATGKEESIVECSEAFAGILEQQVQELSVAIRECDMKLTKVEQVKSAQHKLQAELVNKQQRLQEARVKLAEAMTSKSSLEVQLFNLRGKVAGLAETELQTALLAAEKKAQALTDGLNAAVAEVEKERKLLEAKAKELTGYEEQLKALTNEGKIDFEAIDKELFKLKELNPQLQKVSEEYTAELNINKSIYAETKGKGQAVALQEKRKTILEKLKKVARGEIANYKIPLETHVQGYYMDKVVEEARSFLHNVSGARYELVRRMSDTNTGKTGLDLNVIDIQNGCSERSVGSLSGGESFSGALALLIALSNVVQSFNGGAENNVIFVDEGFGSLDGRFLERVISAQSALSNNNRSIGIISHRPELEENIPLKLTVKAEDVGGYLTSRVGYEGV